MLNGKINEILSNRRQELGMDIKELSEKVGLSVVSLYHYEKGEVLPCIGNLYRLSNALKLNYDELYELFLEEKKSRKV